MKKILIVIMFAMALLGFTGCKPTEKNYKAAYDAARQKRQAVQEQDAELVIPGGVLQQADAPVARVIGGDTVRYIVERLKVIDGTEQTIHRYNVAVSKYKMKTNCSAQVSDLVSRGYEAFGARNVDGEFYVIAGSYDNLGEAVAFDRTFRERERNHVYSGLPSVPVIIESVL